MKKWLQLLKKDERGLTLVELLAVIVILAIVGAIAFVAIGNITENAREDAHVTNAQQIISAAKLYEASGEDNISTDSESPTAVGEIIEAGYLDQLTDPWNNNPYARAQVYKDGTTYFVNLVPDGDAAGNCDLTGVPETELRNGREVCNDTGGGEGGGT